MTDTAPSGTADIIEALGIADLPPAEREEILLDLGDLIFRDSLLRLIERMDDATRDEFTALLEKDPEEEAVLDFLKQRVPDADAAVEETVAELRDDILAVTR